MRTTQGCRRRVLSWLLTWTRSGPVRPGRPRDVRPRRLAYSSLNANRHILMVARSKHMQITDILDQVGGLQSIARELGISETQAAAGAAALTPAILGGLKKQAQAPAGLEGLGGLLGQLGGGGLLDNVLAPEPTDVEPRQRSARPDLRLQGRQPHGRSERGLAVGTRPQRDQEDAADRGDARRRLHGEAARRRRAHVGGGGLAGMLGGVARRTGGRWQRPPPTPDSVRCSTSMATAIPSTTS